MLIDNFRAGLKTVVLNAHASHTFQENLLISLTVYHCRNKEEQK